METDTRRAEEEVHPAQADDTSESSLIDLCRLIFGINFKLNSTIDIMIYLFEIEMLKNVVQK